MDSAIQSAEANREASVTSYHETATALDATASRTGELRAGIRFAPSPNEPSTAAAARAEGMTRANRFFGGVADRLDDAIGRARAVPEQLGVSADAAKNQIAAAMDAQKVAISARVDRARRHARGDAAIARAAVAAQAAAFIIDVGTKTTTAITAITTTYGAATGHLTELETTNLDQVNAIYAAGKTTLEGFGPTVGAECTQRGEDFAGIYAGFRHCRENGFWDGDLSERRSMAQEKSARKVAKGYHDRSIDAAKKRAREVTRKGRKDDRCAVLSTATHTRTTLDEQFHALITGLETARDGAIAQAGTARDQLIAGINGSLAATLHQLDQHEHDQRQLADDSGYMQQVLQEQMAHATAAAVQRGVEQAASAATDALASLQTRFETAAPPPVEVLEGAFAQVEQRIGAALDNLRTTVDGATTGGEDQLASSLAQGLGALEAITTSSDEATTGIEGGFSSSMAQIAGTDNFASQRTGYTAAMQRAATSGSDALNKAVDGMRDGCEKIKTEARKALGEAGKALDANLRESKQGMECEIPKQADEAASQEAPAWKMLVAILLIIIVIVIVIAVTIATAGMALGPLATIGVGILIGAAVGAVTSALITIATDLWSNRALSASRIGKAALTGAITGAIGGGIGAAAGLAFKGATVAVQFAATMVVAAGIDVGTQYFLGGRSFKDFSWTSLGITLVVTALTFGLAHHVASTRVAPTSAATANSEAAAEAVAGATPHDPVPSGTPHDTPPPAATPHDAPPPAATPHDAQVSPKEAALLENTAPKSSEQLSPTEATTERAIANKSEGHPIDDPPYVTEHELPNGHKVKETADGKQFSRCTECAVFNENGELIGKETPPGAKPTEDTPPTGPSEDKPPTTPTDEAPPTTPKDETPPTGAPKEETPAGAPKEEPQGTAPKEEETPKAPWKKPKGWRLPKDGTWAGTPGDSTYTPNNPESLGLKPGDVIQYKNGVPDFSPWQHGPTLETPGLNGTLDDFPLMHKKVAEAQGLPNQTAGKKWLSDNGLSPHHIGGDEFQLIPTKLHDGIRHTGGAYGLRTP